MVCPIERKHKYEEEWSSEKTKKWLEDAEKQLREQGDKIQEDYQKYEKEQFSRLEIQICSYLFEITEERAKRAKKINNLLRAFKPDDRKKARELRSMMEKYGAGVGKPVEFQAVMILLREEEYLNKEETNSASIPVFRVKKDDKGDCCFIDTHKRTYSSWNDYLDNNNLPKGIICYPKNGFVLQKDEKGVKDENGNTKFVKSNEICCAEPPSCKLWERVKGTVDKVVSVASPFVALTLFWTPVGWIGTAFMFANYGIMGYQMLRQAGSIYDKSRHSEAYAADVFQLITTISTMILAKGTASYAKKVALERRSLTFFENVIITATLQGMAASQIFSFLSMTYRLLTKDKITALDILNFVVASQNLYSCVMSPKTANALVTKMRKAMVDAATPREDAMDERKAEHERSKAEAKEGLRQLEEHLEQQRRDGASAEAISETERLIADQQKNILDLHLDITKVHHEELKAYENDLERCERDLEAAENAGDHKEIERLRFNKEVYEKKIEQYTKSTEQNQQNFLDDKGKTMKHEGTKDEYSKFVRNEQNNRGTATLIDQNGRIIRAVTQMDAEMVFKGVHETQSTVKFADGHSLVLHFNEEFRVHPSAIGQMNNININQSDTDLKRVLQYTKDFKTGTLARDQYLTDIGKVLKRDYRMIADTEASVFLEKLNDDTLTNLTPQQRAYFTCLNPQDATFNPEEAYRMRMVVEDSRYPCDKTIMQAAVKLAERRGVTSNPDNIASCVEIIKGHANEKVKEAEIAARTENPKAKITRSQARDIKTNAINNLLNGANEMENLNTRIDTVNERIRGYPEGTRRYINELEAYYHTVKHNEESWKNYYAKRGEMPPENPTFEQMCDVFHKEMADTIIQDNNLKGDLISQYGQFKTNTYNMNVPKLNEAGEPVMNAQGRRVQTIYMGLTRSIRVPIENNFNYQPEPWSDDVNIISHYDLEKDA